MRLITANLLHERVDTTALKELLGKVQPDVMVAQELAEPAAEVISGWFEHSSLHPSSTFTGRGIGSNLPVAFGQIEMPGRFATVATVETTHGQVTVAGMHLINPVGFPWWRAVGLRRAQLENLESWMAGVQGPLVVAGDMNASPLWPAYKRLATGLDDLVVEAYGDEPAPRTWAWRPGWPRLLRIDHVFGRHVRSKGADVVEIAGSDHWAVIVDVEVAQ